MDNKPRTNRRVDTCRNPRIDGAWVGWLPIAGAAQKPSKPKTQKDTGGGLHCEGVDRRGA
ncbi:MAG: hypothetical protein CL920_00270 [Deltaproteobacteria bacterium]|nr:hypothetical protein [Deltaproteobacteria bacterium]